ncbi:MAG: ABC transporter ATP-binding protein [Clostridiales bacterium]|nr:ABC transporter ATP-binding protein [Clostridiales bacterium]
MNGQRETLRAVLRRIGRYKALVFLSMALSAAIVAATLAVPYMAGQAIDLIVRGGIDFKAIGNMLMRIALVVLATSALQWVMNAINNSVTFQVVRDLRRQAFETIERLPLSYIDSHAHGELVSRVIADADQFADGLLMGFTQLFTGVMTILGTLGILFARHWQIALVVVVVTPLSLFVARFIATRTHDMFVRQSVTRGTLTGYIDEMIGSLKVVKAFGREDRCMEEFESINEELGAASLKATFFSSLTNPCTRFVNSVVYALVALTGALACLRGTMTVGLLTSFLAYANQYTKPFNEISGVVTELQNAIACAQRLLDLIDEAPETPEPADAVALRDVEGRVQIDDVSFSYDHKGGLIEHFRLDVRPGQRVAIVGPTGCGKTTLINLLMRFYDVDAGAVRVEGHDIRAVTRRSLRKSYGMVLQETWLKAGTVAENIAMGKPDATREEIVAAAKASHAHSFIRRLPDGYDTVIGEDGGVLSQGQKQLLCITRVMLCVPPMLILDEATSSIDTRTEMKIQSDFARLMQGRTSFIVAHRLSTIRNADVILVMKNGRVIEQGDHQSLMALNGFYAELVNSN